MTKIQRLDPDLVTLIAAGEVVERPASVLKELVDNALDSGAGRVTVEIEEAGKRRLEVSDDGEGMSAEDALLALERHATSKIRSAGDLAEVSTLGFRGEALPAIAAVSRLEIATAAEGAEAVRVRVEAGGAPRVEAAARARGTTVTVRDLFFATPARRKFLKSDVTELRRLLDAVVEAGLARPDVSFSVRAGGREILKLPAAAGLEDRLAALYGPEYAAELVAFSMEADGRRLAGLLQRPDAAARGARRQLLFVNGRPVQDRVLLQAALRGYASTLPQGAFPHLFLFLTIPLTEVDVNVHPAKREVRFRQPDELFALVQSAVRRGLGGLRSAGDLDRARGFRRVPVKGSGPAPARQTAPDVSSGLAREPRGGYRTPSAAQLGLFLNAKLRERRTDGEGAVPSQAAPASLWQLHDTFILVQTGTGLAVIDQHSAHERVLYEALVAAFERRAPASQELVFPRTYQLSPAEWQAWEEHQGLLASLGFRIEPFGERTLALRAVPALGWRFQAEEALLELLGDLAEARGAEPNRHERLARALACRAAIKSGQRLSREEMTRLCNDLFTTALPTADVHGRPAVIQIRLEDLARRFERA